MIKMRNNKAAIKQVFTFLLVAILIGLIFLFAIKIIPNIIKQTCDADFVIFADDLKSYIERYNTFGSTNIESVLMPCEYTEICFIDAEVIGEVMDIGNIEVAGSQEINPMIKESLIAGVEYNVFLLKGITAKPITFSQKLRVVGADYICIKNIAGKAKIKFVGQGKTTAIEAIV
jgi:hypothetical protein